MRQSIKIVIAATALAGWASAAAAADKIVVGNLVDFTGRTAVRESPCTTYRFGGDVSVSRDVISRCPV